ncbi:MAG: HAMP domain-containing histidine kinase [Lachnospiraceae bacterium]|nr:HAMP domain-containing histidine kinase [Butyrivibrio sp.]MCM1343583.1 HAMP domain-containing histidine kinase [Muribaculaceae bacterium]MCM1411248.1 HAMP domain-containing histidine kinase [Lachnospiraceae bacterium]
MSKEMEIVIWGVCLLTAVGTVLFCRYKQRSIYRRLSRMFSDARDGVFVEQHFDESMVSALESRWAEYLAAAETTARQQLDEKEKIKTLIADISHQTKTPISNLSLYSELLLEQELPPEARQYAEAMNEQAGKLNFLIAALVKMSRLETGIFVLKPERNSVDQLLRKVAFEMLPKAEEKGLQLILEQTEDGRFAVFDEKWTEEAVVNIVDNAIKYTEKGSVTLGICLFELFCCIRVSDTGMGIPEEEQAKIFSRFYRGVAVGTEGVGIGLYLAREILAGEGGYVKVSSRPGEGSVFSVYLPW